MGWISTWACAQYYGDETGDPGKASALAVSRTLEGSTLRQIIRAALGGSKLRLTFSNEYGSTPMTLQAVHIAKALTPARSDTDVHTDTKVTFNNGQDSISIPAGKTAVSDPADFKAEALQRLAVSVYFGQVPQRVSCHAGARANSFISPGNTVSAALQEGAAVNTHWFALSNAEVFKPRSRDKTGIDKEAKSIIILGDSITDGYGVTDEQYTRWTDILTIKLQQNPATRHLSVINMGIGTNKLLNQANPLAAKDRFARDVLSRPDAGYFIFFIGVNDLAETSSKEDAALTERMIAAYDEMIQKAKAKNIKTYACTILPYSREDRRRHIINDWLRDMYKQDTIDGLIDFDMLVKDPKKVDYMLPQYDNDGLHPSVAAYAAMGNLAYQQFLK